MDDYNLVTPVGENTYRFDCDAEGLPMPKVQWYKDFEKLDKENLTINYELTNNDRRYCELLLVTENISNT